MATPSSASRPLPGDVLVYGFLWSHEAETGRDYPVKDRPCVVVLAVGEGDHPMVTVAPITTLEPDRAGAIQLSPGAVGLRRASWVVPWELNVFKWPGPDIGRAERPAGAWWRIGALAPDLRRALRNQIEAALHLRRVRLTRRSE